MRLSACLPKHISNLDDQFVKYFCSSRRHQPHSPSYWCATFGRRGGRNDAGEGEWVAFNQLVGGFYLIRRRMRRVDKIMWLHDHASFLTYINDHIKFHMLTGYSVYKICLPYYALLIEFHLNLLLSIGLNVVWTHTQNKAHATALLGYKVSIYFLHLILWSIEMPSFSLVHLASSSDQQRVPICGVDRGQWQRTGKSLLISTIINYVYMYISICSIRVSSCYNKLNNLWLNY